ncbi:histidine kinase [Actinophytocola oryzae]|uniref:histidine kinase n=1 Tax=Actinophytocola oryzae TaxID=502181 RepID=UPI001AAE2B9A|nr:histidine kinase [Actinophytocola oryzae]
MSLRGRIRPLWLDVGLTVLVVAVQLWPFLVSERTWDWRGYVVVVVSAVPVLWRRQAPVTALLTSLLATSLYDFTGTVPDQPIWYGGLIAAYSVAVRSPRWLRLSMLVATVGGSLILNSSQTALRVAVLFVAVYATGRAAATSRAHAERLEHEREVESERAAERERARIARDMHDILSHAVSLMVVQAEAGPVMLKRDPAKAEAAFEAIASAGRDAMVQLRRILQVLHTDEQPQAAPQPRLADLPTLVAASDMRFETTGRPFPVAPDVELAVYRITQEAITNVIRHAAATRAEIHLGWETDAVTIEITDDGTAPDVVRKGNGLIGIQERATACGGVATAGPRTDGPGFRVTARFPTR